MTTDFHADPPVWADTYVWEQAEEYANRYADLATPPNLKPVIAPGIQKAWNGLSVEERWQMLAQMQAGRLTEGAQAGASGLGSIVVPIGTAIFNLLGSKSLTGAQANNALGTMLGGIAGTIKLGDGVLTNTSAQVNDILKNIEKTATTSHTQFMSSATSSITDVLKSVGVALDDTYSSVRGATTDAIESVADTTNQLARSVSAAVEKALSTAVSTISKTVDGITTKIGNALGSAVDALSSSIASVVESVRGIVGSISDTLGKVVSVISDTVSAAVDAVSSTAKGIVDKVSEYIGDAVAGVKAVYDSAVKVIGDTAQGISDGAKFVYDSVSRAVTADIGVITDLATGVVGSVTSVLESLQGAVSTLVPAIGEEIKSLGTDAYNYLTSAITADFGAWVMKLLDDVKDFLGDIVSKMLRNFGIPDAAAERMGATFAGVFGLNPIFGTIAALIVPIYIAVQAVSVPGQMIAQKLGQDLAVDFPIAIPDPSMLQEWMRQSIIADDEARGKLRRLGFSPEDTETVVSAKWRYPEIGIVQTWYLREFITEAEARALLSKLGFQDSAVSSLLQMSFFIPPVQDLITMAVREVFSPAIAEKFGQFEDFPPEFAALAKQQGVSEEWAKNYWAAHWGLPSLSMGYEMLHRRVITLDELNVLLRAQDVMPYWRDKLVQISYNPLTRVDVRRMHKLGVLTDEEVYNSYLDLGYDDTNAKRLRDFTILSNRPTKTAVPADLTKLSTSMVIQLYSEGTIARLVAADLLHKLGVGELAAQVYLEHADLTVQLAERKANVDLVLEQSKAGVISRAQAQDKLAHLGLTATETVRALVQLDKIQASQTQLPSRADLDRFAKKGLISDAEYLSTMQLNGYSDRWANMYLSLTKEA